MPPLVEKTGKFSLLVATTGGAALSAHLCGGGVILSWDSTAAN